MFSPRWSASKGPFKAIWVAAYFHSKLKKTQIVQTDIVSAVDKMLQDDFGAITYRVLAYLLLGVVRIQSKKVKYMFDDCQQIINRIKEFIGQKHTSHAETLHAPYNSITLPDRFELDAFDLGIIEDFSRSNVVSNDAITLKDTAWENLGMVQFSLDKYQFEFSAANRDSCLFDDDPPDEDFLLPYMMENDVEVGTSYNQRNLEESLEKIRDIRSQEDFINLEKFNGVEPEDGTPALVEDVDESHHYDGKLMMISKMADLEETIVDTLNGFHEKPQEIVKPFDTNCLNIEGQIKIPEVTMVFTGLHENPPDLVKPFGKDCLNVQIPEVTLSESDMPLAIEDDTDLSNVMASMEKLQNVTSSNEKFPKSGIFFRAEEESSKTVLQHDEEKLHTDVLQPEDVEMASSEDIRCQINTEDQPSSFTPNKTPKFKFSDPSACTTPKYMVLPTPTTTKPIQKRKRKCIIDDPIVLSNLVMKNCIEDPSYLVSKRRKVHNSLLAVWKACKISSLPYSFLEPLLNCPAVQLSSLICTKKVEVQERMNIEKDTEESPESAETVEPPAKIPEFTETVEAAEKVLDCVETSDNPRQQSVSVSPLNGLEEPQIAPETPIRQASSVRSMKEPQLAPETPNPQTPLLRSIGTFKDTPMNSDTVRPASLFVSTENDSISDEDQEVNINLMIEEISSRYEDNDKQDVSPGRTRIARILKQRGEEETVNLSQVLKGKTKKYSAQLFYEILVLKSGGYVAVEQACAYGDIHVWRLPKWEQTDGASKL